VCVYVCLVFVLRALCEAEPESVRWGGSWVISTSPYRPLWLALPSRGPFTLYLALLYILPQEGSFKYTVGPTGFDDVIRRFGGPTALDEWGAFVSCVCGVACCVLHGGVCCGVIACCMHEGVRGGVEGRMEGSSALWA
jgi:hypothetical protein